MRSMPSVVVLIVSTVTASFATIFTTALLASSAFAVAPVWNVTLLAGSTTGNVLGPALQAQFNTLLGAIIDSFGTCTLMAGNLIIVDKFRVTNDSGNNQIKVLNASTKNVTVLAGSGVAGSAK